MKKIESIYDKEQKYQQDEYCYSKLWNDRAPVIIYDTNNIRKCGNKIIRLKSKYLTKIDEELKISFRERMELKPSYRDKIIEIFPLYMYRYSGVHIRTWGFFNDFKDIISKENFKNKISTFNLERVRSTIMDFVKSFRMDIYLASESIKIKEIVMKDMEKTEFKFYCQMISVIHSKTSNKRFDFNLLADIEMLSNADSLLLSSSSSLSQAISLKNKNCDLGKCKYVRTLDKNLY